MTTELWKRLQTVEQLIEQADYDNASKRLAQIESAAARSGIQSSSLLWFRCIIDDNLGRHEEALTAVEAAISIDPVSPPYRNSRRVILSHLKAEICGRDPADPKTPRLWNLLARVGEADDDVHLALVRHHLAVGESDEAFDLATAITLLSPANAEAWQLRADAAARLGQGEAVGVSRAEAAISGARAQAFVMPVVGEG